MKKAAAKKINISQSLIKDVENYYEGKECGHLVYRKYSEKLFDGGGSDVMAYGSFFEFIATGALPKSGEQPKPDMLSKMKRVWTPIEIEKWIVNNEMPGAIKTPPIGIVREEVKRPLTKVKVVELHKVHKNQAVIESMQEPYRRAYDQGMFFRELCEKMGVKVLGVQKKKTKNGLDGTCDIHALWRKEEITIDLKYSGIIHDQWSPMGWEDIYGRNDRGVQYGYHSTQSTQYTYLFNRPFYFWVFSSAKEGYKENIFMLMDHTESEIEHHLKRAKAARESWIQLSFQDKVDKSARPEYNKCRDCMLFEDCEHKITLPEPKVISF